MLIVPLTPGVSHKGAGTEEVSQSDWERKETCGQVTCGLKKQSEVRKLFPANVKKKHPSTVQTGRRCEL